MNFEAFLEADPMVQIHAAAAMAALALGAWMLAAPKGTIPHRTLGWSFVALMTAVAGTAIFIRQINPGALSWIHIFVPITAFSLASGLFAIKRVRKDLKEHRSAMFGLFFGALMIPGLFAFWPGRLMHTIVFG